MDRGGAALLSNDIERIRAHLDRGAPWDACDAFREAFAGRGDDGELVYWGALAHARAGATKAAHSLLDRCDLEAMAAGLRVEALSLRGRLWKDALHRTRDAQASAHFVRRARAQYLLAYAIAHDAYPGVNAATLAMIEGDRPGAIALAREVVQALDRRDESVWSIATRAEARLLVGEIDAAAVDYAVACERAYAHAGVVAAMRRQLALLARVLPPASELLSLLPAPDVVAFAGHLVDDDDREAPRFPASLVPKVREALERGVARMRRPVVFSSAACGADLLFVEAALANGAEVNVVLPFARHDFLRTSVAVGGDEWVARFDDALARASRVIMATDEQYLGDHLLFEHAALLVEGFARLRAAQLETSPCMLCVIDPQAAGEVGGTRRSYDRWKASGDALQAIDLRALRDGEIARHAVPGKAEPAAALPKGEAGAGMQRNAGPRPAARAPLPNAAARAWKALLFADFAGFSRVQDAFAPRFHERFLDLCARAIAQSRAKPLDAKTWGDALHAVFDTAHEAADFALRFLESTHDGDWSDAGLPGTSRIRVALHAGPVFRGYDPVMQREDFYGSSVTRAARIEPVTQPGTVYASEAFAATLAAQRDHGFALEYIGRLPLAKAYGDARIYRIDHV